MSDIAISVQNLSKRYRIGLKEQVPDTFVGSLASWLKSPLANYRQLHKLSDFRDDPLDKQGHELGATPDDVLYALRDVSFDIKKGEVVGIIGRNGAGKSTLLKILSRITEPTSGRVEVHGRVASLLEVGTGFHPELTGRENIYLNGTILGMRKAEIDRKFDEIVAFSEIEKFLDTPVKRYSSGMSVRLAFAVAAHLDPEILIVDEVLAVGDAEFQKKCLGKMEQVSRGEGRTILFVSHQMGVVTALCRSSILLERGSMVLKGSVADVVPAYLKSGVQETGELVWPAATAPGNERIRLFAVRVLCNGMPAADVPLSRSVRLELDFENLRPGLQLNASFHLLDKLGNCILATGNLPSASLTPDQWGGHPHPAGRYRVACELPANFLNEENYSISAFVVSNANCIEAQAPQCLAFRAHDDGQMRHEYTGVWIGMIRPRLPWFSERIA